MRWLLWSSVALTGLALTGSAKGSCGTATDPDPRVAVETADAVVVAHLAEQRQDGSIVTQVVAVDERLSGAFADQFELSWHTQCGSDGYELPATGSVALILERDGKYVRMLHRPITREAVQRALQPLRHPGRGKPFFVQATGSKRDTVVLLDRRGRALASANGGPVSSTVAVCPGGRRFIQFPGFGGSGGTPLIRRVSDLEVIGKGPAIADDYVDSGATCLDPDGRVALGISQMDGGRFGVFRFSAGQSPQRVASFAVSGEITPEVVILDSASGLRILDARTGRLRARLAVDNFLIDVSPGERYLLVTDDAGSRSFVVDLADRHPSMRRLPFDDAYGWAGRRTLLENTDSGPPIRWDVSGRRLGTAHGWNRVQGIFIARGERILITNAFDPELEGSSLNPIP